MIIRKSDGVGGFAVDRVETRTERIDCMEVTEEAGYVLIVGETEIQLQTLESGKVKWIQKRLEPMKVRCEKDSDLLGEEVGSCLKIQGQSFFLSDRK